MSELNESCCECSRKSALFNCLTKDELVRVSEARSIVNFKAGEIIVKQGAPMSHVLSFTKGLSKVYIEGENNKNLILKLVAPTSFIGTPGIYHQNKHFFTVAAIEDSSVCFIDIKVFKELVKTNTEFAEAFIKELSVNGVFNYDRFISLTQKNMSGRIADILLYLHDEVFCDLQDKIRISNKDIADLTAMSKDSVVRVLKDFCENKYIEIINRSINILDIEKLKYISKKG